MKTLTLTVAPEDAGRTIQAVLHDRAGFSHAQAKGLIDAGAVRPAGPAGEGRRAGRARGTSLRAGDYAHRVASGEIYQVRWDPGSRYHPRPGPPPGRGYEIVHQDRDIMVVDKKADLLTVPTSLRENEESLIDRLREGERKRGVRAPRLFAVHRLDRDTSGLLLFARTPQAFQDLRAQFAERSVERRYLAVVEGELPEGRGRFESRLVEDPKSLKVHSTKERGAGRPAITEYEVEERLPGATVVSVRLLTGRKNQIRAHFSEAGHPLLGDRRYGKPSRLIGRTALHARTLSFAHPNGGRRVTFTSTIPRDLKRLVKALRPPGI